MPGRYTTDATFIVRQLQEKYQQKKKNIYFVFADLEKAFDHVPRRVLWWEMRKLRFNEWIIIVAMEVLSHEFRADCLLELLQVDYIVIVAESLGELKVRLKNWKDGLEEKEVKVNFGYTQVLRSI